MARTNFEIIGLNELIKAFAALGDDAMPYLVDATNAAGEIILQRTKEKAPVGTGALRDSLKLKRATLKPGKYVVTGQITFDKDVAYGVPVELGHGVRNKKGGPLLGAAKAHPFMRPAADESKQEVIDLITNAMNKALENMGGLK